MILLRAIWLGKCKQQKGHGTEFWSPQVILSPTPTTKIQRSPPSRHYQLKLTFPPDFKIPIQRSKSVFNCKLTNSDRLSFVRFSLYISVTKAISSSCVNCRVSVFVESKIQKMLSSNLPKALFIFKFFYKVNSNLSFLKGYCTLCKN